RGPAAGGYRASADLWVLDVERLLHLSGLSRGHRQSYPRRHQRLLRAMGARTDAECALRARRRAQQAERQDRGGDQGDPVSERPLRGTPCIRPQTEAAGLTEPLVSICQAAESFWGPGC